jgi:hypothetical protein
MGASLAFGGCHINLALGKKKVADVTQRTIQDVEKEGLFLQKSQTLWKSHIISYLADLALQFEG